MGCFSFLDPNSVKNLRKRAGKLPKSAYQFFLNICADQLEAGKMSKRNVKLAIRYMRAGIAKDNIELQSVAVKLLNLSQVQTQIAIILLDNYP